MNRIAASLLAAVAMGACGAARPAAADNLLGFYAGLGAGDSTVRSDRNFASDYGYYDYDHDHHTAWKAMVGIRPLAVIGAELEYIDFGHPGGDAGYYNYEYNYYYGPDSHPRAIAAFGVGHIPLPLPFLDVYAKAGVARLHTNVNGFDGSCGYDGFNPCAPTAVEPSHSVWDTRFAYGAGVQYRFFFGMSVRAEYERISSPYGDPDLFSVGATYTF
jgi:opacity protein-like surface antigen